MKVFLDVNCFFDFVLGREPFYAEMLQVFTLAVHKDIECGTNPNNFPFAYYYMKNGKTMSSVKSKEFKHRLAIIRKSIECTTLSSATIDAALSMSKPDDLEDAVMIQSALNFKADIMLSRDKGLLKNKQVKTMTPSQFLKSWTTK